MNFKDKNLLFHGKENKFKKFILYDDGNLMA